MSQYSTGSDDICHPELVEGDYPISFMARNHLYFVYIVECSDHLYYTGVTNDVEKRLWEHNTGIHKGSFTFKRRPVVLRYYERFIDINKAIEWEKQIKGWGRKKKEALFSHDWDEIVRLSNFKSGSQSSTSSD